MPFCTNCGTKLLEAALFCSNCGNSLQSEQSSPQVEAMMPQAEATTKVEKNAEIKKDHDWGTIIITAVFSFGSFIIGGWDIGKAVVWGSYTKKSFILDENFGVLFKFNYDYYGLFFVDRFFNSPFISWVLLGVSLIAFSTLLKTIFGSNDDDDGDDETEEKEA